MGNIITSFSVPEGSPAAEWLRGIRENENEPTVSAKLRQLIEDEGVWMLQVEALRRQRERSRLAFKHVIRDCEKCNDEWWACQE